VLFLEEIIVNLNPEHYATAKAGNGIGYKHGPYYARAVQQSL
jgi:hypothetical protein